MAFDWTRAFESDDGVILGDGGAGYFTGSGIPVDDAPVGSIYARTDLLERWEKYLAGSGNDKWRPASSAVALLQVFPITLQHNGTVGNGTFLGYSSLIPGDATPVIVPRNTLFRYFTFSNSNSADFTLEFRKNSTVATPFYTISKTSTQFFNSIFIDELFSAGDEIYVKYIDNGTNASDVGLMLFFQVQV